MGGGNNNLPLARPRVKRLDRRHKVFPIVTPKAVNALVHDDSSQAGAFCWHLCLNAPNTQDGVKALDSVEEKLACI